MRNLERCFDCDDATGRAGRHEDSLYIDGFGPYCEQCFEKATTMHEVTTEITRLTAEVAAKDARDEEIERLRVALEEISKGEGRYSSDPLEHAGNCIEDMIALANAALEGKEQG